MNNKTTKAPRQNVAQPAASGLWWCPYLFLSCCALLLCLPTPPAWAAETVIDTPQTTTTTIAGVGDSVTVTPSGSITITSFAGLGISASGASSTVNNAGTITASGVSGTGVLTTGTGTTLVNSGTISTSNTSGTGALSAGNSSTITNNGTITTTGTSSIGAGTMGTGTTLTNSGTIAISGADSIGFLSTGDFGNMSNSGTITAVGATTVGMRTSGSSSTLTNSGTISTSGFNAVGIHSSAGSAINSGTITTTGSSAYAIHSDLSGAIVTNTGSLTTTGDDAYGLYVTGNTSTVNNTGTITTSGISAHGIVATGLDTTINNSGNVTATGLNSIGIYVGPQQALINSGSITATSGYAIFVQSAGSVVTLQDGTNLNGSLGEFYFNAASTLVLSMKNGPSAVWDFVGTPPTVASSSSGLLAVNGSKLIAANTNAAANGSASAAQHVNALAGMLDRVTQQAVAHPVLVASLEDVGMPQPPTWTAWSMGYGEKAQRGRSDGYATYSNTLWGGAVGLDKHLARNATVGLFIGSDESESWFASHTQRLKTQNVYGGLRAGSDDGVGLFWNASGYAGVGDIQSRRVVSGASDSKATTSSAFGGLSGSLGHHWILDDGYGATIRGRATYGVQSTNGYTENIASTQFVVDDHTVQVLSGRIEAGPDFFGGDKSWQGTAWRISPRVGVEGWRTTGNKATNITFGTVSRSITDDTTDGLGALVGFDASTQFHSITLSAMAEGRSDCDGTTSVKGFLEFAVGF